MLLYEAWGRMVAFKGWSQAGGSALAPGIGLCGLYSLRGRSHKFDSHYSY